MSELIIEACVTSITEAICAAQNGATRIELCIDIDADGLTPEDTLIASCLSQVNIPVKVLVRPRAGNFVYNREEVKKMMDSIYRCKRLGVQEVVIGALLPNNELDIDLITKMAAHAAPMKVCIHKAIDETPNPITATQALCNILHVTGILTSGGHATAIAGAETIRKMIVASQGKLEITAAGKILKSNLSEHHKAIQGNAYHGRRIVSLS